MFFHCGSYPVVTGRKNIWTPQREHQKHVRRPNADAFHLREVLDHFVVGQFVKPRKLKQARRRLRSQILQVRRLLLGQTRASQLRIAQLQNAFRSERLTGERGEALEDGRGRVAIELLVDDRLRQTAKLRRTILHTARPDAFNDGTQDRVGLLKVNNSLSHDLYIYHKAPPKAKKKRIVEVAPEVRYCAFFTAMPVTSNLPPRSS